jgi:hypothetical protein
VEAYFNFFPKRKKWDQEKKTVRTPLRSQGRVEFPFMETFVALSSFEDDDCVRKTTRLFSDNPHVPSLILSIQRLFALRDGNER